MSIISLHHGTARALVDPHGAQITSCTDSTGRELLWQGDQEVWADHSPILFPVCGAVKDGRVIVGDAAFPMPKHGFAMQADFRIARQSEDFVDLMLTSNEETRAMYPFDFTLHVIHTLHQDGFTTSFLVENASPRMMPFCQGGHPGFCCPMEDGASFVDYQLVFPQAESGEIALVPGGHMMTGEDTLPQFRHATVLPLDYALFDQRDTLLFTRLKSRSVQLVHRHTGKGLQLSFPDFGALAVWTMPGKHAPYLCLEPWQGLPATAGESGKMEDKPFAVCLSPGQCYQSHFTVQCI